MHPAKTPEQIAKAFGCTVEQARAQMRSNAQQLRRDEQKVRASKAGKLRGLTAEWFADRAAAFEAVL